MMPHGRTNAQELRLFGRKTWLHPSLCDNHLKDCHRHCPEDYLFLLSLEWDLVCVLWVLVYEGSMLVNHLMWMKLIADLDQHAVCKIDGLRCFPPVAGDREHRLVM